ncbi:MULTISPECIES: glyoxalase superfamily protein [Leisingera]|uniref:glyoxalase superfamily protein n=1 Tax=Leisingera TaxID=191028 RepID=UPI0004860AF9|nr:MULTISPECIES: glyoxalase superfamily protein [Leisingera]
MQQQPALPPVPQLKAEARLLRKHSQAQGQPISHSTSLERIAQYYGFRDWNTLSARASNILDLQVGMRVEGKYLGQPFTGYIHGLSACGTNGHRRITLQFDTPVDVVRFDSFSSWRQRVSAVIGADDRSPQKTANGLPHLTVSPLL